MSFYCFWMLGAHTYHPSIQKTFEVGGAEEYLFVVLDQSGAQSKEIEGNLRIILKFIEISQHIVDSMRGYMIECLLKNGLIVSVCGVSLQTELDSVDEAWQVIRFVSLHHHLQEGDQVCVEVSAQDAETCLHDADRVLYDLIQVHEF